MSSALHSFCFLCLGLFASAAQCGQVTLDNGDIVSGEIFAIQAEQVIWASELFGHLKIAKNRILEIQSSMPMKMTARRGACYWGGMEGRRVLLECDRYGEIEQTFISIRDAVQYDEGKGRFKEYRGRISATGASESGNVRKQDWALDSNVFFRYDDYRHDLWLKYWAQSQNQDDLKERREISYQFDWFFAPQTFWSSQFNALSDDPLRIELRSSVGTGIGYQFWESRRSALSLKTGPRYVDETTFDQNDPELTTHKSYSSWQVGSDFRYKFPRDIVFFNNMNVVQSLEVDADWELASSSGLSLPIAGGVTADINFYYAYDNTPPEQKLKIDRRLRVGVGYQW